MPEARPERTSRADGRSAVAAHAADAGGAVADGAVAVVRDVGFTAAPGAPRLRCPILALHPGLTLLLGPNGAGKSTLLRLVAGVERPEVGSVHVAGVSLWDDEVAARRALVYLPDAPDVPPYVAVDELVALAAALHGAGAGAVADALARVALTEDAGRGVRELSLGQRRRALLAAALVARPRLAVLDEPLEAMDAAAVAVIVAWLRALIGSGGAALVATHDVTPLLPLATAVATVRDGHVSAARALPAALDARAAAVAEALAAALADARG